MSTFVIVVGPSESETESKAEGKMAPFVELKDWEFLFSFFLPQLHGAFLAERLILQVWCQGPQFQGAGS